MKRTAKKIGAVALAIATSFCFFSINANADQTPLATLNAGLTASFEQSYYTTQAAALKNLGVSENSTTVTGNSVEECIAGYKNLGVAKLEGHLNIRKEASTSAEIVGKIPTDAGCEILETLDGWYKIQSGKVTGYVSSEFMLTGNEAKEYAKSVVAKMAVVTTDTLRVRSEATTDSKIIMLIPKGEELEVLEDNGQWVMVEVNTDKGWISKEFADVSYQLKHAVTIQELKFGSGVSNARVQLVQEALKYVGNPYVWGGVSLTKGADCSGYVLSLYKKLGIVLPHSSRAQAGYGRKINASQAKPGDLFFYGSGSISHVAIYIGNGQVVHAYSESAGIKVTSAYYRKPICVTSLLD